MPRPGYPALSLKMRPTFAIAAGALLIVPAVAFLWPRSLSRPAQRPPPIVGRATFEPVPVSAPDAEGLTLSGTVKGASGQPVAGAQVFLAATSQASLTT